MKNKYLTFLIIAIVFISMLFYLNQNKEIEKSKNKLKKINLFLDSIEIEEQIQKKERDLILNVNWDTVGIKNSGIIITKAKFISEEYSSYKSIQLTYKNISEKKIKAISFKWYGINAFEEPADCGGYEHGFGGGFDDDGLSNGESTTSVWSISSNDGDKIIKAWPNEVVYIDGSKWKSSSTGD